MTDRTNAHLALVGPLSETLIKALKAEDTFDVQQHDTVPYDASPAGLVLSGDGPKALGELEIERLLQSKTVIALFKPSPALLETVHKATNTPIDIPSLELVDDLPLLIYSVNGVVHVAPNNVPCEAKVQELVSGALDSDSDGDSPPQKPFEVSLANPASPTEHSVLAISRALVKVQNAGSIVSNLDPPSDVIGFKKGTLDNTTHISITWLAWRNDGQYGAQTSDPSLIQKYELNWYTDFYSYARYLGPTSGYCGYYFIDCHQTGTHSGSSMNMVGYQPKGPESQSGTTYNYSIDLQQDMQMFNNNGNSAYTFKAQYTNHFSLDKFQQHASQDSSGVDYCVDYKDYYDHWSDPNFNTDTWWNPGVYEKVKREGWKHWIVREYLPADNVPINALTTFTSSVGKHTLYSKFRTAFRAFKSNAWHCTSDDSKTHFQLTGLQYNNNDGWSHALDLTWPKN